MKKVLAVTGISLLAVAGASAEETTPLAPGARVRVRVTAQEKRVVGKLVSLDGQGLEIQLPDEEAPRLLPRGEIESLAVSTGRGSRGRGALYGAGIGAVVGAVAFMADNGKDSWFTDGEAAAIGVILCAPLGALVGVAIPPAERWKEVPLSGLQVSVRPVPGRGAGVFVTLSF